MLLLYIYSIILYGIILYVLCILCTKQYINCIHVLSGTQRHKGRVLRLDELQERVVRLQLAAEDLLLAPGVQHAILLRVHEQRGVKDHVAHAAPPLLPPKGEALKSLKKA